MALKNLNKGRFIAFLTCRLKAWELRHEKIQSIDPEAHGDLFRAEQGHIIGDLATLWFDTLLTTNGKPKGVNIDKQLATLNITRENPDLWLQQGMLLTQQAMQDPSVFAIYEATFSNGSYTTRADILARTAAGSWNMIEVKSIGEKAEKSYIQDMAYTTGVLLGCGVALNKIGLMRIDREFTLQKVDWLDQPSKLLNLLSINWGWQAEILQALAEFNAPQAPHGYNLWQIADLITSQPTPPSPNWHPDCKDCESCRAVFSRHPRCHPVIDLPYIGSMFKKFQELKNLNVYCLEDVPVGFFELDSSHQRTAAIITESIKRNQIFVGKKLYESLRTNLINEGGQMLQQGPLNWPVLYLDFEFLGTAIPLYQDSNAYQNIPFQYSLHRSVSLRYDRGLFIPNIETLEHREFLADPAVDGRRDLARKFLQDIRELGLPNSSIMVYSRTAEETCIKELAILFDEKEPDIAAELRALLPRLVDLYAIISRPNLYHPAMVNFKLKTVAKVFLPGLYENLNIASGDAALAAYGELAYAYRCPKLSPWESTEEEKNTVLASLRKYCQLDTYSLAALHQQFAMLSLDCPQCFHDDDLHEFKGSFRACPNCLTMIHDKDRGHQLRCSGTKARLLPWKIAG
jgi:hypothetical protein